MPIRVASLGGFHVYRDDIELDRLAGKRLRAALLVYVAVERSVARESLLTVFWPESNTENARHALRQTLYHLKTELGVDPFEINNQEVRASAELHADVHDFDVAIQKGEPHVAARLYRGPFLAGVNLIDVQPWESWVDARRTQYARGFRKACRSWIDARLLERDLEGAIAAAHHWVAPDPLDDEAQHRLIALLAEAGERTAAIRQYETYERLLKADELRPLDETTALIERVRTEAGAQPKAAELPTIAAPGKATVALPAAHTTRRRILQPALAIVSVLLLLAAVLWGVNQQRTTSPVTAPTSIAVLPFSVRGGADAAYLGQGMVNLLGTALDGVSLRPIDARAVFAIVAQHDERPSFERGSRVAARLGAGLFVLGDVIEAGNQLRIEAAVYRADDVATPVIRATVSGSTAHVFELVDSLAAQLLAGLGNPRGDRLARTAAVTTGSLPAFKAYLQGEAEIRAGQFERAEEAYTRAIAHDSTFAVAHYRLAVARDWAARTDSEGPARAAARHAQRLTPRDRALLEALLAYMVGDAADAERRYRAILARYPDDLDAWFQLAEVLSHFAPVRGRSTEEAEQGWRKVLSYEPRNLAAILHLARLAAAHKQVATLDSLLAPFSPTEQTSDRRLVQVAALRAIASNDTANLRKLMQSVRGWEEAPAWQVAAYLTAFAPNPAAARQAVLNVIDPQRSVSTVADLNWFIALLHLESGQLAAARRVMKNANVSNATVSAQWHRRTFELVTDWWMTTLPFAYPDSVLQRTRRTAASSDVWLWSVKASSESPITSADPLWSALLREALGAPSRIEALRLYIIGALSLRLRDDAGANTATTSLSRLAASNTSDWLVRGFDSELRARRAWQQGNPEEALRILDEIELGPVSVGATNVVPFMAHAQRRYLRGELLIAVGRDREALPWFASLGSLSVPESSFRGIAHLRQAEIYERLGNRAAAARHYQNVVELWRDSDSEIHSLRERAQQRLVQLEVVKR